MNIAILVRRLTDPGGAERSQFRLGEQLEQMHNVDVFGLYGEPDIGQNSLDVRNVIDYRLPGAINRTYHFYNARRKGYASLANKALNLVVTQHAGVVIGDALKRRQGVSHVAFVHDHEILGRGEARKPNPLAGLTNVVGQRIRKHIERRWYRRTDAIFVPSEYMAEQLRDDGLNPVVMYAIVPAEQFARPSVRIESDDHNAQGHRSPGEPPTILHINPKPHKGIETTIQIAETQRNWQFLIVGSFDNDALATRVSEAPNIEALGYISDIRDAYWRSDVLLIPSRWEEPGATIALEAGMGGVPPVVSSRGGLPELVADERQRVQDDKPGSYIDAISKILADYDSMSLNAENHAYKRRAEKQIDRFTDVVSKRCNINL